MTAAERWAWALDETANILGRVTAGADLERQITESLNKAATPDPIVLVTPAIDPSAILNAVRSWQQLVEQLGPHAGPNEDPAAVLARLLRELTALRVGHTHP